MIAMGKKTVDTEHLTRILFKWAADFSVDTDIVARTATSCYKTAASLALKLPDVDPESLRQRTHLKYNATDRTLTCLNCSGEAKLGDYDNPEDFKYCPFCGFKVVKIAGCGNG